MRRSNLGLVLRHLRDHGPRSRARIAQETGLNKATVSSLVAELTERGLVSAGELHRGGTAGRPGLIVHLDGRGVCGIGVELNVDYVAVLVLDLCGTVLFEERVGLDVPALGVDRTLDEVARLVRRAVDAAGEQGADPAGVTVAVPGLVQSAAGVVSLAPNLHWQDVPVLDGLRQRLDLACPMRVENDANLSAIAEWSMGAEARTPDLVYLTGEVGVGGGVISGGRLLSGADGLSGEVGHLALGDPAEVVRLRTARLLGDRRRPGRPAAGGGRPRRPGPGPRTRPRDPAGRGGPPRGVRRRAHAGRTHLRRHRARRRRRGADQPGQPPRRGARRLLRRPRPVPARAR